MSSLVAGVFGLALPFLLERGEDLLFLYLLHEFLRYLEDERLVHLRFFEYFLE